MEGGELSTGLPQVAQFAVVILQYLKYTFTDLIIAMVSPSGSQGGEIASRESIELSFSTVKQEYVVQNQQGGSGGTITAGYDFKANKEI